MSKKILKYISIVIGALILLTIYVSTIAVSYTHLRAHET